MAAFYVEVRTVAEMQEALKQCAKLKLDFFILGKGSNCFFDDEGFHGVIIHNKIDFFKHSAEIFHVGAGYNYSLFGTQTARLGYGGLEFAAGIPASVGGAVYMNAGANGGETSAFLLSVDYVNEQGEFYCLKRKELDFAYRSSSFHQLKGAIVGATFCLEPSETARQKQIEIVKYRQTTQPYKDKSAGCVFRNPEIDSAGQLIDSCGLKGFQIGGAQVSDVHANFLINSSQASSKDFLDLMIHVRKVIESKKGIKLQSEVCYVPAKRIPS